jgi:hypothetical protein
MHYTLLHLPSGTEVYALEWKEALYVPNTLTYSKAIFTNIREVRAYINNHTFYELLDGRICGQPHKGGDWRQLYESPKQQKYISKHLFEPKRYEDV